MNKPLTPKHRTTNWSAYNDSLCQRGRSPSLSDAAIQFCLMIKNLYCLALRQTTGMVRSLLKLAGLDWEVPDFSTVSRRQKHLQVTLTHQRRGEALHLLVDSTGIKMLGEGEWKRKKHGAGYRRQGAADCSQFSLARRARRSARSHMIICIRRRLLRCGRLPGGNGFWWIPGQGNIE